MGARDPRLDEPHDHQPAGAGDVLDLGHDCLLPSSSRPAPASRAWKQLSLALVRVVAVLVPTDRTRRHAFEAIRLDRAGAAEIPSYLPAPRSSVTVDACHGEQARIMRSPKGKQQRGRIDSDELSSSRVHDSR
jgi:hypothetical protein